MTEVRIEQLPITHPDAARLIEEVQAEYVERYGAPDLTHVEPENFESPHGAFLVAYEGDRAVATGAWRTSDVMALGATETAELKRMYVVPDRRKAGIARQVLTRLEESARDAGRTAVVLETGTLQPEAIGLYESSGYVPVPGFGLYKDAPESRCFGRLL